MGPRVYPSHFYVLTFYYLLVFTSFLILPYLSVFVLHYSHVPILPSLHVCTLRWTHVSLLTTSVSLLSLTLVPPQSLGTTLRCLYLPLLSPRVSPLLYLSSCPYTPQLSCPYPTLPCPTLPYLRVFTLHSLHVSISITPMGDFPLLFHVSTLHYLSDFTLHSSRDPTFTVFRTLPCTSLTPPFTTPTVLYFILHFSRSTSSITPPVSNPHYPRVSYLLSLPSTVHVPTLLYRTSLRIPRFYTSLPPGLYPDSFLPLLFHYPRLFLPIQKGIYQYSPSLSSTNIHLSLSPDCVLPFGPLPFTTWMSPLYDPQSPSLSRLYSPVPSLCDL